MREVGFLADIEGNSGVSIYSRELYNKVSEIEKIRHIEPFHALKPGFLNKVLLDPFKIRAAKDILHVSNQDLMSGYGIPRDRKIVVTVHDIFPYLDGHSGPVQSWMATRYVKNIEEKADQVIAISEATRDQLLEHTEVPESRIDVVYQGVDLDKFRRTDGNQKYSNYYLHVGSELERKNIDGLLDIFSEIKEREEEAKLVRVGTVSGKTERLIEEKGLVLGQDVIYESELNEQELVNLYSGAKKLLFPSTGEGFGRPVVESLACGTPVITYDIPPMNEIVSSNLTAENQEEFVDLAVAEELKSPEQCRAIAEEFTWEKTARETVKVYEKCRN